ncbi:DDE-type integrase/transposase/recombinase [Microvirga sp. BT688]|uniref:Mu transposase C-terminal domain-containing protein n=1 Tax=Microvirga sp. TaxID=1873136 RepID=UPI0016863F9D|nr:Mu transposase C-terminal domain-containing protein [Microvirga sp.]MBD2746684.1 DDE-type integrase/transposase/recombinase [Microvirga sp.]
MTVHTAPPRLVCGSKVRVHGRLYVVGEMTTIGRIFTAADDGSEISLSFGRQNELVRSQKMVSESQYEALPPSVLANLKRDFGSFSTSQQIIAKARYAYVRKIYDLPAQWRDKKQWVDPALASASQGDPGNLIDCPSFRQGRSWYLRWLAAGFDIRALVSDTPARGNRAERYEPWVIEEINNAIDEVYATRLKGSVRQTLLRARSRIRCRANAEHRQLPRKAKNVIGRKIVENTLAKREEWELLVKREGRHEADRLLRLKGAGPPGDYPLAEVEADHTQLDVIVAENGVVLGKPYFTVLIDRYSRMIIGFTISFAAPSWVSVMEALRHAVLPKEQELRKWAEYGQAPFVFDWPCFGAPDCLAIDQGPEFLSASMTATASCLNMRILQLPRASGDKKGKVESNFKRINKELFHLLDGTTLSNPQMRKRYDSQKEAKFSISDVRYLTTRWVVDHHNREKHPGTGEIPAERWREGMDEVGEKPAPPSELIAPLVGKVVPRKLRDDGVRYNKLRWNSNAFRALRNRIGFSCDVLIRIDPLDLGTAYILDPDDHTWVEGQLMAESSIELLTLRQYEHLRKILDDAQVVDDDYELKLAQGLQRIWDFVDSVRKRHGVVPKHIAAFITEGSRPVEHIHSDRIDPDASSLPISSHEIDAPSTSPPPDPNGPYRDVIIHPTNPYPPRDGDGYYPGEIRPGRSDSENTGNKPTHTDRNTGSPTEVPATYPGRHRNH